MKKYFVFAALIAAMFVGFSSCKGGKTESAASADTTAVAKDTAKTDTAAAKVDTTAQAASDKNAQAEADKGNEIDDLLSQYESKVNSTESAMRKAFNGKITEKAVNSVSNKCEAANRLSDKLNKKKKSLTAAQKKKFLKLEGRMRDILNGMNELAREQMQGSWEE